MTTCFIYYEKVFLNNQPENHSKKAFLNRSILILPSFPKKKTTKEKAKLSNEIT